ncbi:MAG: hypothetical protein ACKVX9_24445 [Blastocatellia bacterium]
MKSSKTKPSAPRPAHFHASLMPLFAIYAAPFAGDLAPVIESIVEQCRAICDRRGVNLDELVAANMRRASANFKGGRVA